MFECYVHHAAYAIRSPVLNSVLNRLSDKGSLHPSLPALPPLAAYEFSVAID